MDRGHQDSFGAKVGQEALQALRTRGITRKFGENDQLFMENECSGSVFLVESGLIKVYVTAANGKELILGIYGRGELLCELSAMDRAPRSASGRGRTSGTITEIPGAEFRAFIGRHPAAMQHVLRTVQNRLHHADRERLSYLSDGVRVRVIRRFLHWADQYGREGCGGIEITGFSRRDLAQSVAASEKTVDDVLTALTAEGSIATNKKWFLLRDIEGLRQSAEA
ncbi:CRP-like cAMP-binding protein [Amycolatopsis lexingtonensis]|uniref:CRP-like cAMP-binding protein n=1 Tax=Amycolatopsis lexingtonensis TaxID=218822 RepID=A0ABR9I8H3_9PSEU|nr:Crp/Fnr family transcriptional regulator [Amycolatopsis lexingtonensis]MBE1499494.1 CRP-like cAMP-binding protein [Amycolatopsis lexingtonensis]